MDDKLNFQKQEISKAKQFFFFCLLCLILSKKLFCILATAQSTTLFLWWKMSRLYFFPQTYLHWFYDDGLCVMSKTLSCAYLDHHKDIEVNILHAAHTCNSSLEQQRTSSLLWTSSSSSTELLLFLLCVETVFLYKKLLLITFVKVICATLKIKMVLKLA